MTEDQPQEQHPEYLEFLMKLVPELIIRSKQLTFDKEDRFDQYAVMLYASIVELANSVCRLVAIGEPTGSRTLTRTALEAFVDLKNLMDDQEYVKHLDAKSLTEWLKTYEIAVNGNEFFVSLAEVPGLTERIEAERAELDKLKEQGFRPLNVFERFDRAGMDDIYQSVYRWFCSDSHNSFRGLMGRHLEISDDGAIALHILKETPSEYHLPVIDVLSGFLIDSSQLVHARYGKGPEVIDDLEQELSDVRERLLANHDQNRANA